MEDYCKWVGLQEQKRHVACVLGVSDTGLLGGWGTDWEVKDEDNWVWPSVPNIELATFTWLGNRWVVGFFLPTSPPIFPFLEAVIAAQINSLSKPIICPSEDAAPRGTIGYLKTPAPSLWMEEVVGIMINLPTFCCRYNILKGPLFYCFSSIYYRSQIYTKRVSEVFGSNTKQIIIPSVSALFQKCWFSVC